VQLGIRAEHIATVAEGSGQCDGVVEVVEYLGADTFIVLDCGELGRMSARVVGESELQPGESIGLQFDVKHTHFFDADGVSVGT
jgi:multiple sugar transport system ATP-binding protein